MSVKARLRVNNISDFGSYRQVNLNPVYSSDKDSPNYSFSQATPSGNFSLNITNPAGYNGFEVGKVYDIEFNLAPEDAQ